MKTLQQKLVSFIGILNICIFYIVYGCITSARSLKLKPNTVIIFIWKPFFTPNYLYNFFSDLYDVPVSEREARKKALFEKFGVDRFAEVKVSDLSTGMKQKVSLVISLVHNPEIIIFDEPTNGLDVLTAKVVTDFLVELKKQGKTIIVSTHIFNLIEKICDRVGIVIDGKMAVCDTLEGIVQGSTLEDRFFEIYEETVGESV